MKIWTTVIIFSLCTGSIPGSHAETTPPGVILTTNGNCMLGHVEDKKWNPASEHIKLPADFISPASYDLYSLNKTRRNIKATALALQKESCESRYYVNFPTRIEGGYTALGNVNWNPLPRPVTILKQDSATYKKVITDLLREKGVENPKIRIVHIVKTDIQGDGKDEVFINATYFTGNDNGPGWEYAPMYVRKGDYSFVAFREVIDEKPVTNIVVGEIFLSDSVSPEPGMPPPAPSEYHISTILDLNGDGVMELIVDDTIHEGNGARVYVMENGKFIPRMDCGCGV